MDTRQKILSLDEVFAATRAARRLKVIVGYFDPMTAAHARGIQKRADECVVVLVGDPPDPILPQRARAELAAALNAVDYVIAAIDNTSAEMIARLQPDEVVEEEIADLDRTQQLIALVKAKVT